MRGTGDLDPVSVDHYRFIRFTLGYFEQLLPLAAIARCVRSSHAHVLKERKYHVLSWRGCCTSLIFFSYFFLVQAVSIRPYLQFNPPSTRHDLVYINATRTHCKMSREAISAAPQPTSFYNVCHAHKTMLARKTSTNAFTSFHHDVSVLTTILDCNPTHTYLYLLTCPS